MFLFQFAHRHINVEWVRIRCSKLLVYFNKQSKATISVPDPGEAQQPSPPPPLTPLKLDRLCVFFIPFCIRMFKNKAQMAQDSIYKPYRASSALRSHNLLRPTPKKKITNLDPP